MFNLDWSTLLKPIWPIILFFIVLLVVVLVIVILPQYILFLFRKAKAKKQWQQTEYLQELQKLEVKKQWQQIKSLRELQKMDPLDFEEFVVEIFENLGFKNVKRTGGPDDEGIDITALNKKNEKCLIQCKRYSHKVSVGKVRDFYGAMADKGIDRGYFVTTNFFTFDAERFCDNKPIELIDGNKLIKYSKEVSLPNLQSIKGDILLNNKT